MRNLAVLFKLMLFGFAMLGGFAIFSNTIPQTRGEPPVIRDLSKIQTVDEMIELGAEIFGSEEEPGRGTCPLCHKRIGGRAPILDGIIATAGQRVKSEGYKGKAKTAEEYIWESEECPSCFVVPGFGTDGDTKSPMPKTTNPPIELKPIEVDSLIAFFQDRDGMDITVKPHGAKKE